MAGEYINPAVNDTADGDATALADLITGRMQTRIPGWEEQDGTPERYIFESIAIELVEAIANANGQGQTFERITRWLGVNAFNVPAIDPIAATAPATVTAVDDAGYTVEAGMEITVQGLAGERVGFAVIDDVVIAPGDTSTADGEVTLVATVEGVGSNDVQADAQVEDIGPDTWIASVTLTAPSSGGSDGETDLEYLDRFVRRQRRTFEVLVVPRQFEGYAVDWIDETYGSPVDRALAIDLYNPDDSTYDNEGMVTVAVIDDAGAALGAPAMAALEAAMLDRVQAGMAVNVIAPTYTPIDVTFSFITDSDYVPADVKASTEAAVADALSPANWGRPTPDSDVWNDQPIVDIGSLESVIKTTPGVARVTAITVEGGTVDVTLTGVPALPTAGTITGTAA